ncbi:MAG TPA: hypothetical protein DCQ14_00505 [Firmicutes bacterium]|nr:hypothetical protein [Bacillota bacterium]
MQRVEAGMTLLEVVLGVALLSIVFLSFINLFAAGLGASMESGRVSQAALLAQEEMELLRANSYGVLSAKGAAWLGASLPGSENFQPRYLISGETLLLGSYPVRGLRLDVIIMQGDRGIVRVFSFVREGS